MAKTYLLNGLTISDLQNMEVALRLLKDACFENSDLGGIKKWEATHRKVDAAIERISNVGSGPHLNGCLCRLCEAKRIRVRQR